MRKLIISFLILICVVISQMSLADPALRNPQGRMGFYFKTEKYVPLTRTNVSPEELAKLGKIIDDTKKTTKKSKLKTNSVKSQKQEKIKPINLEIQPVKNKNSKQIKEKEISKKQNTKSENIKTEPKQQTVNKTKKDKEKKIEVLPVRSLIISTKDKKKKQEKKEVKSKEKKQSAKDLKKQELQKKQDERVEKALQKAERKQEIREAKFAAKTFAASKEEPVTITEESQKKQFSFDIFKNNKTTKQEVVKNDNKQQKEQLPQETKSEIKKELPIKKLITNKKKDIETRLIIEEITSELTSDRPKMLKDLSTLWVSAVQRSDTVYFAIMKLSNPNADEVNKKGYKKILEPIVNAAPLVGQAFVNPALTAGSLIGSNVMGTMMNDSAKARLAKVNDADLVILARAIDDLQETLLTAYMEYRSALDEYRMAIKISDDRKAEYEKLNKKNSPNVILASTFYSEALDNQYKARQEFLMKRVVLEQMVGADALNEIENPESEQEQETPSEQATSNEQSNQEEAEQCTEENQNK